MLPRDIEASIHGQGRATKRFESPTTVSAFVKKGGKKRRQLSGRPHKEKRERTDILGLS